MTTVNPVTLNWANAKVFEITATAPYTHYLANAPTTGQIETVKDYAGNCATYNITVNGNLDNIDAALTKVMATNYEALRFYYNGTRWSIF